MNNKLFNLTNPYQGTAKKVLCVCSAGLLRSPTAANVLHKTFGYNTRAAGSVESYALIFADKYLLTWADEIVCMSTTQFDYVTMELTKLGIERPLINLNVPDEFGFMDETLQGLILQSYKEGGL